jgi:hypothetical protein
MYVWHDFFLAHGSIKFWITHGPFSLTLSRIIESTRHMSRCAANMKMYFHAAPCGRLSRLGHSPFRTPGTATLHRCVAQRRTSHRHDYYWPAFLIPSRITSIPFPPLLRQHNRVFVASLCHSVLYTVCYCALPCRNAIYTDLLII